jgi:flagellar FliL protein
MTEATPKKPRRLLFLLLAGVGLLLLSGGGLAYLMLTDDSSAAGSPARAAEEGKGGPGAVMSLEPFLVNLADQETRRYLKIRVELGVDQEKTVKELEKALPRIRDAFILLLGSKTYKDLASPEGKLRLKEEMMAKLAQIPGGKKVREVFFTEFVAQ